MDYEALRDGQIVTVRGRSVLHAGRFFHAPPPFQRAFTVSALCGVGATRILRDHFPPVGLNGTVCDRCSRRYLTAGDGYYRGPVVVGRGSNHTSSEPS